MLSKWIWMKCDRYHAIMRLVGMNIIIIYLSRRDCGPINSANVYYYPQQWCPLIMAISFMIILVFSCSFCFIVEYFNYYTSDLKNCGGIGTKLQTHFHIPSFYGEFSYVEMYVWCMAIGSLITLLASAIGFTQVSVG